MAWHLHGWLYCSKYNFKHTTVFIFLVAKANSIPNPKTMTCWILLTLHVTVQKPLCMSLEDSKKKQKTTTSYSDIQRPIRARLYNAKHHPPHPHQPSPPNTPCVLLIPCFPWKHPHLHLGLPRVIFSCCLNCLFTTFVQRARIMNASFVFSVVNFPALIWVWEVISVIHCRPINWWSVWKWLINPVNVMLQPWLSPDSSSRSERAEVVLVCFHPVCVQ